MERVTCRRDRRAVAGVRGGSGCLRREFAALLGGRLTVGTRAIDGTEERVSQAVTTRASDGLEERVMAGRVNPTV